VDNAGSRGVSKVSRIRDITESYYLARSLSRTSEVLVEQYMDGKEIAVDAIISKRKLHVLAVSDKIRTPPPYLLDTSVIFPSKHTGENLRQILNLAERAAIDAISLDNCPLHMEIMMSRKGPRVVELAARGAGFKVFTDILPMITGVDTLGASINLSLGLEPDCTIKRNRSAVLHFFKNKPGKILSIIGVEKLKSIKGLVDYDIYVRPGDQINPLTSGADRIGHAITVADERETAIKLMNRIKRTVKFNVERE
jgi:biotin carboxylase